MKQRRSEENLTKPDIYAYIPQPLTDILFHRFSEKKGLTFSQVFKQKRTAFPAALLWVLCAWSVDFRPKRILQHL